MNRLMRPRWLTYLLLVLICLFFLMPLYMTVVTALKAPDEIYFETAWNPPTRFYFQSFINAFEKLFPSFLNSVVLAASATILSALIGSINGYVFSKKQFPGSELVFVLFIFGMFIPYEIILIPLFQLLSAVGLYGKPFRINRGAHYLRDSNRHPAFSKLL